jgi:hypothetical protein
MEPVSLLVLLLAFADSPIPLDPGTSWEYRESYAVPSGELDLITDDVTRFAITGPPGRPFVLQTGGADPASAPVERGDGWIRLGPWTGEEALPLPLEVGRQGPAADGTEPWRVEAEEEVTVPAGTFTALRCAIRTRASVSVLWIAPGTGVVKETQGVPGRRPEIERLLLRWSGPRAAAP